MSCRYCRAVGLVFSPLNFPRCWQNWFSTASELIIAGIIDQPLEFVRGLDIAAQIQDCMIGDLPCIPWRARFFFLSTAFLVLSLMSCSHFKNHNWASLLVFSLESSMVCIGLRSLNVLMRLAVCHRYIQIFSLLSHAVLI